MTPALTLLCHFIASLQRLHRTNPFSGLLVTQLKRSTSLPTQESKLFCKRLKELCYFRFSFESLEHLTLNTFRQLKFSYSPILCYLFAISTSKQLLKLGYKSVTKKTVLEREQPVGKEKESHVYKRQSMLKELVVHIHNGRLPALKRKTHLRQSSNEWSDEPGAYYTEDESEREKDKHCILTRIYGI